jgi:23S rRNA (uracil1939-C5)-methyltransferase
MSTLCRHFGTCGGCVFQDLSPEAYREAKHVQIVRALARHAVEAPIAPLAQTAPGTRRRATLKAERDNDRVVIGFSAARSHTIVDMQECRVITPDLFRLVQELRELLRRLLQTGEEAGISVAETDSGFDLALDLPKKDIARRAMLLAEWARGRNVARISVNGDVAVQISTPTIRIGAADVRLPQSAFLQPSRAGERFLQTAVLRIVQGARCIADLFAGCGTFALVLAQQTRVHAVDSDGEALAALVDAARKTAGLKPLTTETRDLFRRPLRPEELNGFDAVVLDPPRAGAIAQAGQIAQSRVPRVTYVSCNPETFARDAAILIKAGFHLTGVEPVDQFLWSKHTELIGAFERESGWSRRRTN